MRTQEYVLNFGPQHPATHGVFQIIMTLDGEYVVKAEPVLGYLHRGIEKLVESRTYTQVIPYTDRMDYLAAMLMNLGYVQAVEKLMDIEVPERAEYIRIIAGELSRLASHLLSTGIYALDIGGVTGYFLCFRERERVLDLLEELCGSRMTFSYMKIGGVSEDLPEGWLDKLSNLIQIMPGYIEEYDGLICGNEIFQARTKLIGAVTAEEAINYSFSGPPLRASGVNFDLRKCRPYGIYDRFDFEVPLGERGDCFDRFHCRFQEMTQSIRIIKQAMEQIKEVDGPVMGKVPKVIKPPKGEVYHEIESAKGILGYYVVSDGTSKPYRVHVRRPSFINLGMLDKMCVGWLIADVVAIFGSFDVVLGEVDC